MTPDELGAMEPREFINKMIGASELEEERRLWHAYVIVANNPHAKDKPRNFADFCDRMTGKDRLNVKVKLKAETFFKMIGAE